MLLDLLHQSDMLKQCTCECIYRVSLYIRGKSVCTGRVYMQGECMCIYRAGVYAGGSVYR